MNPGMIVPRRRRAADANLPDRMRQLLATRGAESFRVAARRIGVPHATLQRALKGRTPGAFAVLKIAQAHDVSAEWLLTGEGQGPTTPTAEEVREADAVWVEGVSNPYGHHAAVIQRLAHLSRGAAKVERWWSLYRKHGRSDWDALGAAVDEMLTPP